MILINNVESSLHIKDFENLKEIIDKLTEEETFVGFVVTDVLLDGEGFSEIYPDQAEDIGCDEFKKLEFLTITLDEFGISIADELPKVLELLIKGSQETARLFRQADEAGGLEMLQDLLGVTSDFLRMVQELQNKFLGELTEDYVKNSDKIVEILDEMTDTTNLADWILLADLLEFEFLPICQEWLKSTDLLRKQVYAAVQQG